ncbi:pseudouridine synthase, putative [Babesia ovis]|uniref:Pseudouridine synthase, putative n=1 Tax=Babesia ovis TaxID=5869 RepID=A0A9W5WTC3_BABOV|nr:pseudouridine synthase, putative [Babesia ovis]
MATSVAGGVGVEMLLRQHGSISKDELATLYDNLLPTSNNTQAEVTPPVESVDLQEEHEIENLIKVEPPIMAVEPSGAPQEQTIPSDINEFRGISEYVQPPETSDRGTQAIPSDINEFRGVSEYVQPPETSDRGPPTFGDSDSGSRMLLQDGWQPQTAFNEIPPNYVVRNVGPELQHATVSFGYEDQHNVWPKYEAIIDIVNHYKPTIPPADCDERDYSPPYEPTGRRSSPFSNMGGDTTASTHSRFTEHGDSTRGNRHYSGDDYSTGPSPASGYDEHHDTRYHERHGHTNRPSPASGCDERHDCNDGPPSAVVKRYGSGYDARYDGPNEARYGSGYDERYETRYEDRQDYSSGSSPASGYDERHSYASGPSPASGYDERHSYGNGPSPASGYDERHSYGNGPSPTSGYDERNSYASGPSPASGYEKHNIRYHGRYDPSRHSPRGSRRNAYKERAEYDQSADSCDGTPASTRGSGLFEVPFNICALPRIIDPFKGFSKVYTSRAVKLLHFVRKGHRVQCSIEKHATTLLQTHIKDLKVVSISVCGDSRTGKSYLASMLVNKPVNSFRCNQPYEPKDMKRKFKSSAEATVWAYVGVYQEKYAYIYLDFSGFDNHQADRIHMTTFALLLSNCVICSVANPPRTGIYDTVRAMIDLTHSSKPFPNTIDIEMDTLDTDNSTDDLRSTPTLSLDQNGSTSKSFDFKDSESSVDDVGDDMSSDLNELDTWKAPIIHFVFRDSEGHVKCIDERIFTPETLVEQGIFDHYTNLFNSKRKDGLINFRNNMLDAFEIFPIRKYITLPCPVSDQTGGNTRLNRSAASNAANALKRMFATLLAPANADIMSTNMAECPTARLLGEEPPADQPCITAIPTHMLNPLFCERLDEIKACVYQDTLAHTQTGTQLNGRMFVNYLMLLVAHFNENGQLTLKDAKGILAEVYTKENEILSKDVVLQFFKGLKQHVVMQLPMEPRLLLSKCMRLKQKTLHKFHTQVVGNPAQYVDHYRTLEKTLDGLITKLEARNDQIAVDTATALFEKCTETLNQKIALEQYTYEELLVDIAKMRKMFLQKFKGHSQITERVFPQLSQQLYRTFDEHHPKTPMPNILEMSKRYGDQ